MENPLRNFKKQVLEKPAELLAENNISPNTITWIGMAINNVGLVVKELERARKPEDRRAWVLWLGTFVWAFGLAMDALDGEVARAHITFGKDKNFNPNGQLYDGIVDREETTAAFASEESRSLRAQNYWEALMIGVEAVLSNSGSTVRALVESYGGRTTETPVDLQRFGGSHFTRMIMLALVMMDYEQVAFTGLSRDQHATLRTLLHGYLLVSNATVVGDRLKDLRSAMQNSNTDDETIDSAGFNKSRADHWKRAKMYGGITATTALVGAGLYLGSRPDSSQRKIPSRDQYDPADPPPNHYVPSQT